MASLWFDQTRVGFAIPNQTKPNRSIERGTPLSWEIRRFQGKEAPFLMENTGKNSMNA